MISLSSMARSVLRVYSNAGIDGKMRGKPRQAEPTNPRFALNWDLFAVDDRSLLLSGNSERISRVLP